MIVGVGKFDSWRGVGSEIVGARARDGDSLFCPLHLYSGSAFVFSSPPNEELGEWELVGDIAERGKGALS